MVLLGMVLMGGGVVERFRALDPPPYCYLDLFSVAPSSTPRPRCVNSQLVSLPPVGILTNLCSICNICLLFTVSSISTAVLNTFDT